MSRLVFSRAITTSSQAKHFIRKPKFDLKVIIDNIPKYEHSIKNRRLVAEELLLSNLHKLPSQYIKIKEINKEINDIQRLRNQLESEINGNKDKIKMLLPQIKKLKEKFQTRFSNASKINDEINDTVSSLPNLLNPSVPLTSIKQVDQWINKPDIEPQGDPSRSHVEIMKRKNLIELQKASNTSGTSSYYLLNEGAQLELALINYAIEVARKHGFSFVLPPSFAKLDVIDACGFRPRDMNGEKQIYSMTGQDIGLVATAEITLAALGFNDVIDFDHSGVKKIVGLSRCYRAEAGARGKDTKGLYRVHEFSKVELFCWSKPELSNSVLESLKDLQIALFTNLGLYAKVINMPADDLGNPAFKKYDIEAWMPGRESFGEISSTSNCTDFQSRRLHTKFKNKEGNLDFVHTINGTALAVPRVIIAIIENFYNPETDKIEIPPPLIPYMGGKEYI